MYQVVNMENLRSGELYVFSDNEFFNPPSYERLGMRRDFSERADDRVSVARTEHENRLGLPFASRTLVFPFADRCGTRQVFPHAQSMR